MAPTQMPPAPPPLPLHLADSKWTVANMNIPLEEAKVYIRQQTEYKKGADGKTERRYWKGWTVFGEIFAVWFPLWGNNGKMKFQRETIIIMNKYIVSLRSTTLATSKIVSRNLFYF